MSTWLIFAAAFAALAAAFRIRLFKNFEATSSMIVDIRIRGKDGILSSADAVGVDNKR